MIWLGGMLPPIEFDVREYHLQVPKEFFQQGQIVFLPHNVYGNMPLGAEMFALLGMGLTGDWWLGALVGKAVLAAFAPLTALALLAVGRRLAGATAGVAAALVYLSIPWVIRLSNVGFNEVAYGFYLFLAVSAAILWKRTSDCRFAAVAGYLAGAAVSVKYTAVVFVALPIGVALLATFWSSQPRLKSWWTPFLLFVVTLLLGCGLWFAKNAWQSGNPTYPLAYTIFGGETRTDAMDAQWRRAHRPDGYSASDAVSAFTRVAWRSAWQSPLLVPLALIPLFIRRMRRSACRGGVLSCLFSSAGGYSRIESTGFGRRFCRCWPSSPASGQLGRPIGRGGRGSALPSSVGSSWPPYLRSPPKWSADIRGSSRVTNGSALPRNACRLGGSPSIEACRTGMRFWQWEMPRSSTMKRSCTTIRYSIVGFSPNGWGTVRGQSESSGCANNSNGGRSAASTSIGGNSTDTDAPMIGNLVSASSSHRTFSNGSSTWDCCGQFAFRSARRRLPCSRW